MAIPIDSEQGPPSPFDRSDTDEGDLWFLPGEDAIEAEALPRADQRLLFDPADWGRAQGDLSGELAGLAVRFGALDERLCQMNEGIRQRLAIREAAELSWWAGQWIGVERLTLWVGLRSGGGMDDSLALSQAGWAVRRLTAGQGPDNGGWAGGVTAFLGHAHGEPLSASPDVEDLAEVMIAAQYLHPVTQAAVLFHAWRLAGQGPARGMEAAVMAACHGASIGRANIGQAGATFLPLTLAGVGALRTSGSAHARLRGWIRGAEKATLSALMQLDSLAAWQKATQGALSDLTGRTPALLVDLLAAWPIVSAPMAEAQTGASRAAVQRNLEMMEKRGLIREITGQGRYRVWAAQISTSNVGLTLGS